MSPVIRGRVPKWISTHELRAAIAPMAERASRNGGVLHVDCERHTVHIKCVTPDGLACVICGELLHPRVRRVSRFGARHDAQRHLLLSTCDTCGDAS